MTCEFVRYDERKPYPLRGRPATHLWRRTRGQLHRRTQANRMSNWTIQDLRSYAMRRLRNEQAARTQMQADAMPKFTDTIKAIARVQTAKHPKPKTPAIPCVDGYKYHSCDGPNLRCVRCGKSWTEIEKAQLAKKPKAQRSGYNTKVVLAWFKECRLPEPVPEYRFCERLWRFDFAFLPPYPMVAVEVQGGLFSAGAHVRGAALLKEYAKYNRASVLGWRLIFVTPEQLCTTDVAETIRQALNV